MADDKETVDWRRGPKTADLSGVPVGKLVDAYEQRGVRVDMPTGAKGKSSVVKTVVTEMPAPEESPKK